MKVVELFQSIDGEGIRTGQTAVFVRFARCNCRCNYCDSTYTFDDKGCTEMSSDELFQKIREYNCPRITVTGGEPLLLDDQISFIAEASQYYDVNVETNGSIDLHRLIDLKNWYPERGESFITMDWKSISSGESKKMLESNLGLLTEHDVLKFVVADKGDLDQMKDLLSKYNSLNCHIFCSPVFGKIEPRDIVEYVLENQLHQVTVQVQLHKIIWSPDMRGV